MSCTTPCLTCSSSSAFSSCLSCDTTVSSSFTLTGTLCLQEPTWYIQLACTCLLFLFILLPLVRKRSVVLLKIFDAIQMAAYFKYINAFVYYRRNYLYLDMRSMNPWNEGWQLLTISGDFVTPVFLNEQTYINKLARIASIWIGMIVLLLIVAMVRICCREGKIQFSTFFSKNIKNTLCIAFYVTVQDIAFFCAANFYNPQLSTGIGIAFFSAAIIFSILTFVLILWQSKAINYKYQQIKEDQLYNYQLMFLYRMDYDLFPTYSLTRLPQKQKKINRYSNLVLIDTLKKIGYAFLIISFLYKQNVTLTTQTYSIFGFILFFDILWYISLPLDAKREIIQLILNILADLVLLGLLFFPLILNRSEGDTIHWILSLSLFGLALVSAVLEIVLDLYSLIPYDLYDIGLKVVIEDKQLKKELEKRKKQQQENERKIKQLKEEQERLLKELDNQKNKPPSNKQNKSIKPNSRSRGRQMDSEAELNQPELPEHSDNHQQATKGPQELAYPVDSEDGDDIQNYKLDVKKKRVVYNFNKKAPFVYSNKVQE